MASILVASSVMAQHFHLLGFLVLIVIFSSCEVITIAEQLYTPFNRTVFPKDFVFGVASAAYQYEGAWNEDGKGPSIWDTFTHKFPGKILKGTTGDVALDFYHRYKDDVNLLKYIGMDGFRFSISWTRVLPRGKLSGGVNKKGIAFYNNVINDLLSKGIQPFVTIFHWDTPQALEDEYGGFLSPRIADDYLNFAELCFKEFGDRVKHWITFNEPYSTAWGGYDVGIFAPGRCSSWMGTCPQGNSGTEPYIVTHHLLIGHSKAVNLYKQKYQASQKGVIGITLVSFWYVPLSNSKADKLAQQRALDFMYGWFMDPITSGDYPSSMRQLVGKRLPKFTPAQSKLLKGSFDFIGLNYYTSYFIKSVPHSNSPNISYTTDSLTATAVARNGKLIGEATDVSIFFIYPQGLYDLLVYTKKKYNDPIIYITECGLGNEDNVTTAAGIKDDLRVKFYYTHLKSLKKAVDAGVKVKGFFGWSYYDNFEWGSGYTQRFGIVYIDYKNNLKRIMKKSAYWFKSFLLK